ncbi:MAG: DUF5688 family protein [Anaerobutyricum hallii]
MEQELPLGEDEVTTYIACYSIKSEVDGAIYFVRSRNESWSHCRERPEDDLYILPSSVNEVLLVRASELEKTESMMNCEEMVRDAT